MRAHEMAGAAFRPPADLYTRDLRTGGELVAVPIHTDSGMCGRKPSGNVDFLPAHGIAVIQNQANEANHMYHRDKIEQWLHEHGRSYVGIGRPKGYRKWADKACFRNSAVLAWQGAGTYVEGLASIDGGLPIHHAWLTRDGLHAIDPTWRSRSADEWASIHYVGIEFPVEIVRRHGIEGRYSKPLLEDDGAIRALIERDEMLDKRIARARLRKRLHRLGAS